MSGLRAAGPCRMLNGSVVPTPGEAWLDHRSRARQRLASGRGGGRRARPRRRVAARLLGEDIVVWQGEDGQAQAWQDLCVHRGTRLSLGRVEGCTLHCPYHGWVYGADGQCVTHPGTARRATAAQGARQDLPCRRALWPGLGQPRRAGADAAALSRVGRMPASASSCAAPMRSRRADRGSSRTSSTSRTSRTSTRTSWACPSGPRSPTTRR